MNEPRFEKDGLLVEGQSTNLCSQSENIVSGWARNGTCSREKLDGIFTRIIAEGGTMGAYLSGLTLEVGKTYTISFWAYAETLSAVRIGLEKEIDGRVEVLTSVPTRYSKTFIATQTNGAFIAYSAQGSSGAFVVGGFQLEALPFASSYIPTAGAGVTRARDVVTIPWALNVRPSNVSLALNYDLLGIIPAAHQRLIEYGGNTAPRYLFQVTMSGTFESNAAAAALSVSSPSIAYGSVAAASTTPTRHALKLTGKSLVSYTPTGPVNATTDVCIGAGVGGAAPIYGHIRNLRIWHRALTDDQLKAVA